MPQAYIHPDPSLLPIERPRCPKCQGRMMLARIEPSSAAGSDLRTFECPECEYVYQMVVGDPMNSGSSGWQHSELKAPE